MYLITILIYIVLVKIRFSYSLLLKENNDGIDVVDMTKPTTWSGLSLFYGAIDKRWKICLNCGTPSLGTTMHLEPTGTETSSMHPAIIPSEYLLNRLIVIDVAKTKVISSKYVLTLDVALQWAELKQDPVEPTLLLFSFGWNDPDSHSIAVGTCVCKVPGLSYELAQWIASNLTHVVGVATDAPTLESEQTRVFSSRTVASVLGRNGIYMIENVYYRRKIPEQGCLALAMPLKLHVMPYVPTRLTAFCPAQKLHFEDMNVVMALKEAGHDTHPHVRLPNNRKSDVDLEELMTT